MGRPPSHEAEKDGWPNVDFTLRRTFPVTERLKLEVAGEASNLLNHLFGRSPAQLGVAFSEVVMPFAHVSGYSLHNLTGLKRTTVCLNLWV